MSFINEFAMDILVHSEWQFRINFGTVWPSEGSPTLAYLRPTHRTRPIFPARRFSFSLWKSRKVGWKPFLEGAGHHICHDSWAPAPPPVYHRKSKNIHKWFHMTPGWIPDVLQQYQKNQRNIRKYVLNDLWLPSDLSQFTPKTPDDQHSCETNIQNISNICMNTPQKSWDVSWIVYRHLWIMHE